MNREMQKALESDGEKLRQLTGDDHGTGFNDAWDIVRAVFKGELAKDMPDEWQLIESAPKDGTHILAYRMPIGIRVTNMTNPPTVVHWFNDANDPGFYTSVNAVAPEYPFNPTHWMPLPGAPSLPLEQEKSHD